VDPSLGYNSQANSSFPYRPLVFSILLRQYPILPPQPAGDRTGRPTCRSCCHDSRSLDYHKRRSPELPI